MFSGGRERVHWEQMVNNSIVSQTPNQKHLGIFLDARLSFEEHLKVITTKVNKTMGLLRKLQKILPKFCFCETTS